MHSTRLARLREEVRVLEEKGGLSRSSAKVGSPVSTTSTILNKAFSLPHLFKKHSFSETKAEVTSAESEDGEEDLTKLVLSEQEKLADRRKAFVSPSALLLSLTLIMSSLIRTSDKDSLDNSEGTSFYSAF